MKLRPHLHVCQFTMPYPHGQKYFPHDPEKVACDEVAELPHATHGLRLKQETPDPPKALKIVPSLSLQKIPKEPIRVPTEDLLSKSSGRCFTFCFHSSLVPNIREAWVEKVVETPYMTPTTSPLFFTPQFTTPISPYNQCGFNPLFETSTDAEFNRLKSSPPPNIQDESKGNGDEVDGCFITINTNFKYDYMDKQHMLETYQAWQATYINLVGHVCSPRIFFTALSPRRSALA
ncbi:hypothetical protein GYH30_009673 [Glycine max]|uniref:Uncharacterized protein n=1 Tax=Glycine max TaxID=3847 RepID=A0A0R0K7N3_SOYBN|nr:hypothetical protein GYH30_009673 [Glycine max]